MNDEALKQFVKNMRDKGVDDEEIAKNLSIAGHPQAVIDSLISGGSSPAPEVATPTTPVPEAATPPPAAPTATPAVAPQIIKGRTGALGTTAQPKVVNDEEDDTPTTPQTPQKPLTTNRKVIQPSAAAVAAAQASQPAPAPQAEAPAEPTFDVADQPGTQPPPASPATDDPLANANSFEAVTAATPTTQPVEGGDMPDPLEFVNSSTAVTAAAATAQATQPQTSTSGIYPDAQFGRGSLASQAPGMPASPGMPSIEDASPVHFNSNPLVMIAYAFINFVKNLPAMLVALIWGTVIIFAGLHASSWIAGKVMTFLGDQDWLAKLFGENFVGIFAFYFAILLLLYTILFTLFLTLWRTVQLSLTLDIGREDKPEIGTAFSKLAWFGRAYKTNARLVLKVLTSLYLLLMGYITYVDLSNTFFGGLQWLVYGLYVWAAVALVVITRNAFIHLLILDSSSEFPRDASKDSRQLVHQPRQKYFELLAWWGFAIIFFYLIRLVLVLTLKYDIGETALTLDVALTQFVAEYSIWWELVGIALTVIMTLIYDLGLSRYFVASQHTMRTARQIGNIHVLNFVLLVLAGLTIWGGNRLITEIRYNQIQDEYDAYFEERDSSRTRSTENDRSYDYDPSDLDNNGIDDYEQCGDDALPNYEFVDLDDDGNAIYNIECEEF